MSHFIIVCVALLSAICGAQSQIPAGYQCVAAGTCAPNNSIDIRIVTPGVTNPCPAGQVLCPIPPATGNQCGTRNVTISTADGFATQGAYPWEAFIVNQTGFVGGGALLDQYNVLTAAHKVYLNSGTPNMISVYMGVYNSAQLGMRYTVASVTVHPQFNPTTLFNDIAILRLSTPVTPLPQPLINAVCLPTQGQSFVGQNCTVSGWGRTGFMTNDSPTVQQKQVLVPIVDYNTCFASMSNASLLGSNVNTYLDPAGEICAGGQLMKDACTQDGGSPLVCTVNTVSVVVGLVAWGKGCGQAGVYGVYVNVPFYMSWITSTLATLNG